MSFINKDVNKGLLILILSILFVLAGLEVFYSVNFKAMNNEYDAKIKELNGTYNSLASYKNVLNTTKTELELKTEREAGLSNQFVDVKTQRDSLEVERNKLKDDNSVLKTTLDQVNDDFGQLNAKYVALNRTYFNQITQIDSLNNKISSLQDQLAQCQSPPQ